VEIMTHVLEASVPPLSSVGVGVPSRVESILERALASDPRDRFSSAAEMADAVAASVPPASASEVGAWVERTMSDRLPSVRALSAAIQARSSREQPRTPSLVAAPVSAAAEPPRTKPETDLAAAETRVVFVPRSRPQWHRRGRAALVILGLVAAFFGGRLSRAPDVSQAVQQPPRAALVSPQTIAAAAPDVEVPAIAAVERARVTPTVSAIASSGVAPAAVTAPIASSVPRLPPRLPRHDCTPPYEVDAKGARRVKVRCFKPEQAIPRHI
jgi:eukaryotic-like serine/threonine-protein kinase